MLDADEPTSDQASNDQATNDQATNDQATGDPATASPDPGPAEPAAADTGSATEEAAEPASPATTPADEPPKKTAAKRPSAKRTAAKQPAAKKTAAEKTAAKKTTAKKTTAKKTTAKKTTKKATTGEPTAKRATKKSLAETTTDAVEEPPGESAQVEVAADGSDDKASAPIPLFQPPEPTAPTAAQSEPDPDARAAVGEDAQDAGRGPDDDQAVQTPGDDDASSRRRRRRGGRRRRKPDAEQGDDQEQPSPTAGTDTATADTDEPADQSDKPAAEGEPETSGTRRRRRRRRSGDSDAADSGRPATKSSGRSTGKSTAKSAAGRRSAEEEITGLTGSTRLEAKKQRRREGREAGRRRAPIVSEAEFLARREAVDRVMVIRQQDDLTQIAVLEDKVLVEHYVARESQTSLIGNVYLGRVQNVLPSMEAAFIDIGKGRNAVLYAGEVNWDALGAKNGQPRKIESVLKSGQSVMVQVTKDPVGHKGARLTSQISLPGRFLVYVPDGTTSGISRKLPDTERNRLKTLLKEIVPDTAGVIVRTAAEGTSEDELTRDVERLKARWEDISDKAAGGKAPQLLYAEADLTLKVVRDLFTEDFARLVVSGADAWDMVESYVRHVAPDLTDRLERHDDEADVFAAYRIDEQIAKGLDRKVWLPSGGSLVIDRTEAMTVVDVNTGKFTGSGGNLEETVTRNNLEAAEEMVRQLRLRDIGGIIVVDFIDMVLESNRDLVLRRLVECLGRDRTRHQVAEVTSLGLVQMTRKRIGTGLLEAFSETCERCQGRGLLVHHEPVEPKKGDDDGGNRRGGRPRSRRGDSSGSRPTPAPPPSPKDVAAIARPENADRATADAPGGSVPGEQADQHEVDQPDAVQPETGSAAESAPDIAEPGTATGLPQADPEEPVRPAKRSARREQGPAATASPESPAPIAVGSDVRPDDLGPADGAVAGMAAAPPAADAAPAVDAAPAADAAPADGPAPRVVTSVRRRRTASRPAGPPVSASVPSPGNGAEPVLSEQAPLTPPPEEGDAPDAQASLSVHVPVKRKGSRRR